MIRLILELLALYLLYKFIFDFILPIYRISSDVKKKIKDKETQSKTSNSEKKSSDENKTTNDFGEYIDYEEVSKP